MSVLLFCQHLMGILPVLVHLVVFLIGHQREGEVIVLGHLTTEEKRRVTDAPEGHHRELFALRELCPVAGVGIRVARVGHGGSDVPQGQHVAVGVVARTCVLAPEVCLGKYGVHGATVVPEVIHHAPHIGVLQTGFGAVVLCLAGAE